MVIGKSAADIDKDAEEEDADDDDPDNADESEGDEFEQETVWHFLLCVCVCVSLPHYIKKNLRTNVSCEFTMSILLLCNFKLFTQRDTNVILKEGKWVVVSWISVEIVIFSCLNWRD